MSHILLPSIKYPGVYKYIHYVSTGTNELEDHLCISKSLSNYLSLAKYSIQYNIHSWEKMKRYTNPYEYLHTVVPGSKHSVCKNKPISRSYFKMIEIVETFQLFDKMPENIHSFHLAEGPGGFMEAFCTLRGNAGDQYRGMTLLSEDINVPGWKKINECIVKYPQLFIEKGEDGTGNIMTPENLMYVYAKYGGTMDIVTGDGGFDFSIDYNKQEILSTKLLFAQISMAIALQRQGGHFVVKTYDLFTSTSLDLLFLLCSMYQQVYMVKPHTSRYANSEKYIVCKGFLLGTHEVKGCMEKLKEIYVHLGDETQYMKRLLGVDIPYFFSNKIEEANAFFGKQQIENINHTLGIIENKYKTAEKIETIRLKHVQKCIQWCIKYNQPYNNTFDKTNIFL